MKRSFPPYGITTLIEKKYLVCPVHGLQQHSVSAISGKTECFRCTGQEIFTKAHYNDLMESYSADLND